MSELNSIITVTINRLTKPLGQVGFATLLIVGPNATFVSRTKLYSDSELAALAADLTNGVDDPEYKMAAAVFAQTPHINQVMIGKQILADADYTETLNEILLETRNFYGVVCTSRTVGDQEDVAQWVQSNERVGVFASADADIIDTTEVADTTSIAALIKAQALDRSMAIYHSKAATEYADAALLGYILSLTPGTYTGAFKTLAGITVDDLNTTKSGNAHDKYCSTYEEIGERNMLLFSWTGSGEYLDIIIFADWVKARVAENNFAVLANTLKNPFTDGGITAHENATRQILQIGMDNTGFTPMEYNKITGAQIGGYSTTFPKASSVGAVDKAARRLTNAKFKGWLAGAIHTVAIEGTITY